jgi:hypothetical protein
MPYIPSTAANYLSDSSQSLFGASVVAALESVVTSASPLGPRRTAHQESILGYDAKSTYVPSAASAQSRAPGHDSSEKGNSPFTQMDGRTAAKPDAHRISDDSRLTYDKDSDLKSQTDFLSRESKMMADVMNLKGVLQRTTQIKVASVDGNEVGAWCESMCGGIRLLLNPKQIKMF